MVQHVKKIFPNVSIREVVDKSYRHVLTVKGQSLTSNVSELKKIRWQPLKHYRYFSYFVSKLHPVTTRKQRVSAGMKQFKKEK